MDRFIGRRRLTKSLCCPKQTDAPAAGAGLYYTCSTRTPTPAKVPDFQPRPTLAADSGAMDRQIARGCKTRHRRIRRQFTGTARGCANNQTESNFARMLDVAARRVLQAGAGCRGHQPLRRRHRRHGRCCYALSVLPNHPPICGWTAKRCSGFGAEQRWVPTFRPRRSATRWIRITTASWIARGIDMS